MDVKEEHYIEVKLGGDERAPRLKATFTYAGGHIDLVEVMWGYDGGSISAVEIPLVVIERIAATARGLREQGPGGNHVGVCPDHGYFDDGPGVTTGRPPTVYDFPRPGMHTRCPTCAEMAKAKDSVERLKGKETTP